MKKQAVEIEKLRADLKHALDCLETLGEIIPTAKDVAKRLKEKHDL